MAWSPKKSVLVPFDFSDHSQKALRTAVEMADNPEHVHALHVLPFLIPTEPGVVWAMIDDDERVQHALAAMDDAMKDPVFGKIQREVRLGDPGQVIADRAEEIGADVIVIPSHGRTGWTRMLLGSVAERVVRLAKCPVFVIKITEPEE